MRLLSVHECTVCPYACVCASQDLYLFPVPSPPAERYTLTELYSLCECMFVCLCVRVESYKHTDMCACVCVCVFAGWEYNS